MKKTIIKKEPWCAIAPIWGSSDEEIPIKLAENVEFRPLPDWLLTDTPEAIKESFTELYGPVKPRFCIYVEYEREEEIQKSPSGGHIPVGPNPQADTAEEIIRKALTVFWVSAHAFSGLSLLIHFRVDEKWKSCMFSSNSNYRGYGMLPYSNASDVSAELSKMLYQGLVNARKDDTIDSACKLLFDAQHERNWLTRYLLFWIVLEALFGPADGREISFRLPQRLALFASRYTPPNKILTSIPSYTTKEIFDTGREGYTWRSKMVHGLSGRKKLTNDKKKDLMKSTEDLIRLGLSGILVNPHIQIKMDSNKREEFLDSLAWSNLTP